VIFVSCDDAIFVLTFVVSLALLWLLKAKQLSKEFSKQLFLFNCFMTLFIDATSMSKNVTISVNLLTSSLRLMFLFIAVVNVATTSSIITKFLNFSSLLVLIA